MPQTPTTCPLDCPDACGVLVESDDRGRFLGLRGNPAHGFSQGVLCGKTASYGDLIRSPDRLTTPLVRAGVKPRGELRPASWESAIARIVERVRPLRGEQILAAWYAGSMGRVARKFPLRMMHALGATLVDDGLCDNTSTVGYQAVLGRVIGFDLERADECDLVILWGCDMARTVQHLQPAVQRLAKRGVPVVAIDIYRTDTIAALERWGGEGVLVKPGTDAALALALARLAFEKGSADREFLRRECLGATEFEAHVRSQGSGLDLASASATTGVEPRTIERIAQLLARARNPLLKTGVGFARRRNGAMSMRAVCSLAAVLGRADNVHYESFDAFGLPESVIERPDLRPAHAPLREIRHVQLGAELMGGSYRALFVWGHNPAVMCPDAGQVREGLARSDVFVVVHEQFLTESAQLADVVLPATMFPEHADVYRSYGHRRLHASPRACRPPEGPRNNVETFAAISRALGLPRETWDATPEGLCEELLLASRERLGERELEQLRRGAPVKLEPASVRGWGTPSGKIELVSESCRALGQPAMATYVPDDACGGRGEFWLVCAPSKFTHNSTFSHSARHLARAGVPTCHMHPEDARAKGLAAGGSVTLENERGRITLQLASTTDVPRGVLRVDGVPRAADVPERIGINVLVSPELSDMGAGNVLYSTRVDVKGRAPAV
jgi:anaerobic selenocysteine-containing dehydrogenase